MAQAEKDRDMAIANHNRIAMEVEALRAAERGSGGRLAPWPASGRRGGGSSAAQSSGTLARDHETLKRGHHVGDARPFAKQPTKRSGIGCPRRKASDPDTDTPAELRDHDL